MPWGYRLRRVALRPAPAPQNERPQGAHPAKRPIFHAYAQIPIRVRFGRWAGFWYNGRTMSRTTIGYTSGVYDLFHIGHLNLLKNAKGLCDKLIVGVSVDELVAYKHKRAVIPFQERLEIVRSIKYVDAAIPQDDLDKYKMWEKLHFDVLFVGDDWFKTERWQEMEEKFKEVGVRVVYFPYTKGTSSTLLSATLKKLREEKPQ